MSAGYRGPEDRLVRKHELLTDRFVFDSGCSIREIVWWYHHDHADIKFEIQSMPVHWRDEKEGEVLDFGDVGVDLR